MQLSDITNLAINSLSECIHCHVCDLQIDLMISVFKDKQTLTKVRCGTKSRHLERELIQDKRKLFKTINLFRLGCFYMSAKVTELFHKQLSQNTYLTS